MDWSELVRVTIPRPGMWVRRPYVDGLVTLWLGFSIGANDGNFDRFCLWLQCERFPAEGGHRNPLSADAIVREAIAGSYGAQWTDDQDDRAVALLGQLANEFGAIES